MATVTLSHSARQLYLKCQRAYFFDKVQRLELVTDKPSLRVGAAMARNLEFANPSYHVDSYIQLLSESVSQDHADALRLEMVQVRVASAHYLRTYGEPRDDIEREVRFRSPVVGRGMLDGIIHQPVGPYIGVEDKYLSPISWREVNERKLAIDPQVTAYFYAMRERGTPLESLQYRVTIKPGISKRNVRQPETWEQYEERLALWYVENHAKVMKRYDCYRTDEQLDEFALQAAEVNRQMRETVKRGVYPMNGDACTMFGECSFLALCREEPNALASYRRRPERVEPPKLTPPQAAALAALAALADAFAPAAAQDVARQAMRPPRGITRTLASLERLGLAEGKVNSWSITELGREVLAA